MADKSIIGQRIKEIRLKARRTQKDFGEMVGISSVSVMNYEKGVKLPPLDTVIKIAEVFGASIDWICGRDNDTLMNPPETYADILRGLVMATRGVYSSIYEAEHGGDNVINIAYSDDTVKSIIGKWNSVKKAYDSKAINDDLYSLWLEREYKKLSEYKLNGKNE